MIARFTPQMFDSMYYGVYMFFASLMIGSAIFVYFLIPETKGIPLEKVICSTLNLRIVSLRNTLDGSLVFKRFRSQERTQNCTGGGASGG